VHRRTRLQTGYERDLAKTKNTGNSLRVCVKQSKQRPKDRLVACGILNAIRAIHPEESGLIQE
jgi:hypothetical protein